MDTDTTPARPFWSRVRRTLAVVALGIGIGIATAPVAAFAADEIAPVVVGGDASTITVLPVYWSILTGLVTPFLLGALNKVAGNKTVKGIFAILTAAVAALIERALILPDGAAVISSGMLVDTLLIYGPQLATYLGVWQHINQGQGINAKLGKGIIG
jgi:hypothetical protein